MAQSNFDRIELAAGLISEKRALERALEDPQKCIDGGEVDLVRMLDEAIEALGYFTYKEQQAARRALPGLQEEGERRERARCIWELARPLALHGPGRTYLRTRGIGVAPSCFALRESTYRGHPQLVAALNREPVSKPDGTAEFMAVHTIALLPDGTGKAEIETPKRTFGPMGGGTVRFGYGLPRFIAEGIETALSIHQMAEGATVWATCGTGNLRNVRLPTTVKTLTIAADREKSGAGIKAANETAQRLADELPGRRIKVVLPPQGCSDFNDCLDQRA